MHEVPKDSEALYHLLALEQDHMMMASISFRGANVQVSCHCRNM